MKRKLINSFIILTSSTLISKVFSLLNRMLLARLLDESAMALYILVIPTLSLCITLAQFSVPSAVFRLISHPKYNNKKVIISAFSICFVTCLSIIFVLLFFSKTISIYFLKQKDAYIPILTLIPFIPLVGMSGIIKNYYLGKEDVWHLSVAQFFEEVARILFTYFMISRYSYLEKTYLVAIAFIAMSIGELTSITYLYFSLDHHFAIIHMTTLKENFVIKDIMNIALPLTGSRLLHSCYNFIEPILLVNILTYLGFLEETVHLQYAILNGYVISLLTTPTFFNNVVLRLLVPILNRDYAYQHYKQMQKHILYAVITCLFISLPFTFLFYFFSEECLFIMYNTTSGSIYLKYMSIPFTLFYLQTPLSATLQVLNKNKQMFYMSVLEITIEFICLILFIPVYHVLSVAIVMLIGLLTTLLLSIFFVYSYVYTKKD